MVAQTPLEAALERELAAVGLPFHIWEVYHKEVYNEWMVALDFSRKEIKLLPDSPREHIVRHQETLDWDRRLVHRETALTSRHLYVAYDILRTPANEAAFKAAQTAQYDALLDRLIESRAFYCEMVRIADLGGPSGIEMDTEQSEAVQGSLAIMGTDVDTFREFFDFQVRHTQAEMHVDLRVPKKAAFFDGSVKLAQWQSRTILWAEIMGEGANAEPPFYSVREDCRQSGLAQLIPPKSVEALVAGVVDFVQPCA